MDLKGFEPLTSSMPWKRAPNCATGPSFYILRHENTTPLVPGRKTMDSEKRCGNLAFSLLTPSQIKGTIKRSETLLTVLRLCSMEKLLA